MKFTCHIEIDRPVTLVARIFEDPAYLASYQDGFLRKEHLQGTPGQTGATAKMFYRQGKGEMELTETIIENDLPTYFEATYHHKHMDNSMKCRFLPLNNSRTNYVSEIEYTAFRGFFAKAMAFLMPGMFKKQVEKWMVNFKLFVESRDAISV